MKKFVFPLILLAVLLAGCGDAERLDSIRSSAEKMIDSGANAQESAAMNTVSTTPSGSPRLTEEEARDIALKDAGFTADQVSWLRTEYEMDDGIPQYEVDFHQGRWEYSYEIDGRTGEILSSEKDD